MKLALDTSAYSYFAGGHREVFRRVATATTILLPAIVVGELEAAFSASGRRTANRRALEDFLGEPVVAVLPVTVDVARRYGMLFSAMRAAGTMINLNDVWIAAITLDAGAHLLTFDRDFARVPGLDCTVLDP